MLIKDLNKNEIEIILAEVKMAMKFSCNNTDILDAKVYNIVKIIVIALFSLCGIIFIDNQNCNIFIPGITLLIGCLISTYILYTGYKTRKYPSLGHRMTNIMEQDSYYHDEKGL